MKIMQSMTFLPKQFILNVAKDVQFDDPNLNEFADKFQKTVKEGIYKLPCSKREVMMAVNISEDSCTGILLGLHEAIQEFKGVNDTLDGFIGKINTRFKSDPSAVIQLGRRILKKRGC